MGRDARQRGYVRERRSCSVMKRRLCLRMLTMMQKETYNNEQGPRCVFITLSNISSRFYFFFFASAHRTPHPGTLLPSRLNIQWLGYSLPFPPRTLSPLAQKKLSMPLREPERGLAFLFLVHRQPSLCFGSRMLGPGHLPLPATGTAWANSGDGLLQHNCIPPPIYTAIRLVQSVSTRAAGEV